ncbi:MAG: epoxyqueuosine reductase, partial [Rhodospirillaceae bacterium]|nr:epoxyqueuosine reductase [Rhodospirillaceae bacterium]MBT4168116.1 epoxyqueuosine reductase [Rhodospirillaceae bacterium]
MPTSISKPLAAPLELAAELRREALSLGFDALGITAADAIPGAGDRLGQFLDLGRHGDMDWLVQK